MIVIDSIFFPKIPPGILGSNSESVLYSNATLHVFRPNPNTGAADEAIAPKNLHRFDLCSVEIPEAIPKPIGFSKAIRFSFDSKTHLVHT